MRTLDYDNFKFYVGETIEYCQTIEHDVKWIYAIMLCGDNAKNFERISNWTLGHTVSKLEKLDYSDDEPYLSHDDYALLKEIANDRNYLCHEIYRDFLYIENCFDSREYRIAYEQLVKIHDKLQNLQQTIEDVRLRMIKR